MDNTAKAVIATVDFGFAQIDGLMLPDGSYAISIPQLADVFGTSRNTFSRDLKRLLGDAFRPSKIATEMGNQAINVVTVEQAAEIVYHLARGGDKVADAFMRAILQEGLARRFDKAFGKRVSDEEYNALVALRMKRLLARRIWTDTLRDRSLDLYGYKPDSEGYRRWTVKVNERLFNKSHFRCNRDNMNQLEQEAIELFERMAERKAKLHPHASPDDLVEMALSAFE